MITTTFRRHYWIAGVCAVLAVLALLNYHWADLGLDSSWHTLVNAGAFSGLALQLLLAHTNRDVEVTEVIRRNVCVVVPVYNEDPVTFRAMLDSLMAQTRRPEQLIVVDDGSTTRECWDAFQDWARQLPADWDTETTMFRKRNGGKREAQAVAFRAAAPTDVFVTVDSDTVLDPRAIEHGIKPLIADNKVNSVAGLLLGLNVRQNLLTRLIDVGFVSSFLNGRSSWSRLGSVCVNCGALAFYRAEQVFVHLREYESQRVFGHKVPYGDDRILTNLMLVTPGTKAVFARKSVAYTLHPVNLRHASLQRARWSRSFFWGGEWLIRRLSPRTHVLWWLVAGQFHDFVLFSFLLLIAMPYVLFVSPILHGTIPWQLPLYLAGLGYLRSVRYLSVRRSDISFIRHFGIWLMSPLVVLLNAYLVTGISYYALATIKTSGWNTRKTVEVRLEEAGG